MRPFHQILANNLVANVTNFTVWFAVTFWVFIETQSVFATGMIAGIFLVFTAAFGIWFGSIVDHNSKKLAMLGSSPRAPSRTPTAHISGSSSSR